MSIRASIPLPLALTAMVTARAAVAQELVWREFDKTSHLDCAMTFDTARTRFVVVSGARTLEWDGGSWQTRATPHAPPSRFGMTLAYDSVRRRTLMFGGFEDTPVGPVLANTLWEYDGIDWVMRNAVGPSGRIGQAMAFDAARGRLVLFGGNDGNQDLGDTWEWDGTVWTQSTPAVAPVARKGTAMAFHAATGQTVLFGGLAAQLAPPVLSDTWAWNGTAWTSLAPATVPPPRSSHRISANAAAGTLVLFAGTGTVPLNDTWEWNGLDWTSVPANPAPAIRGGCGMATDAAGLTLLLGGAFASPGALLYQQASLGDTWAYLGPGAAWVQLAPTGPPFRNCAYFEYDSVRDRLLLAGGNSSFSRGTWEWAGTSWTALNPPGELPLLNAAATSFDRNRGVCVLYGGLTLPPFGFGLVDWTFEWNGSSWSQVGVPGPPARTHHAMAYDRARSVVLLFGGVGNNGSVYGDTWQWNGTAWTQVAGAGPPSRWAHGMAHDVARARVVLFGGMAAQLLNDTWEWDGSTWTQAAPPAAPSPRYGFACAHDARRSRTVIVGGIVQVNASQQRSVREVWEWDGVHWSGGPRDVPVDPMTGPGGLTLTYHDRLQRLFLMTSVLSGDSQVSSDVWTGSPDTASVAVDGTGCGGARIPALRPLGAPYAGNALFALDLLGAPANAFALLGASVGTGSLPLGSGCTLYLSGTAVTIGTGCNASGFATTTVPIPANPAFVGFDVFFQAAAVDPGAPLGLALTPFVHARIGT